MSLNKSPKRSLARYGLAPSKKRGQNFLVNPETARRIVSLGNYSKSEHVIEVGVGLGALTMKLAEQVHKVIGIELDSGIIRYHETEKILPDNVVLMHADILKLDFALLAEQVPPPFKIIANLPYSISNPFLFKLIENNTYISTVIVMLQKEVSDRLTAVPGTKSYGIPTVLLGSFAEVKKRMQVKPAEFHPRPKIDSAVIEISFCRHAADLSLANFQRIVRTSFSNRRKTIQNNLSTHTLFPFLNPGDREIIKKSAILILQDSNIDPQIRAERLSVQQFEELTTAYERLLACHE